MPRNETRRRMVETASRLFQRDGFHATSWRGLVEEAGTPWGSIAHHFPGGKEELGVAAVQLGADAVLAAIDHAFTRPADEALPELFGLSAALMEGSGYETACPVASVALEGGHGSGPLREASREAFERWEARLEELLPAGAGHLAGTVLTLLEGALVRARVHGSAEPLREAGEMASALVRGAAGGDPR